MHQQVYHSSEIQAWEQRWFDDQNSAFGLMQQVAWMMAQEIITILQGIEKKKIRIAVCCGKGNNAGDGYLVTYYLAQHSLSRHCSFNQNLEIDIFSFSQVDHHSADSLQSAYKMSQSIPLKQFTDLNHCKGYDVYIDALFGIGINRTLSEDWQRIIHHINEQDGVKIAIDMPSGLDANTGQPLPMAIHAQHTLTALAYKVGQFVGRAQDFIGHLKHIPILPCDSDLKPVARLSPVKTILPRRHSTGHKGTYGHVLVIGGHAQMGGAVIMAAEAAFAAGAGKVTIVCDAKHHSAILSRSPNVMVQDINRFDPSQRKNLLQQVDSICFGMGLGRDDWAAEQYDQWMSILSSTNKPTVLDADALWFLSEKPIRLNERTYATPHPGEAAKLLHSSVAEVEHDRIKAIKRLQTLYAGEWVLKGAGSLTIDAQQTIWICTQGNPGMGTGGMGDILAGMIASLKGQLSNSIQLHEIVNLHAMAGDVLAQQGERGLLAQNMAQAIYQIVNLK
ncbi:NAD(P)H-hydrate dehydratase [Acinetobacter sp. DSM 11652]|uniref:NAD(P)H-hydrate dehydratase n=1 Tax=Acinetobacter sp. DSM 11652 TaxID=346222 RepID=UPI0008BCFF45|nr:NAD(P)H-hydrate dehydratase [Acinetobacter sp. DSM 11652]SEL46329.1 yjeF C-terminal region, hydroxyethylthiazole kinase-related/yjeF N-terminal region [Acinetobacter sp. DSM 11652]